MAARVPLKVALYQDEGRRSRTLIKAFQKGVRTCGDDGTIYSAQAFKGNPVGDVAVFYGLRDRLMDVYKIYRAAGKPTIFIDLGYWGRHDGGRLSGYHKININGFHPEQNFQYKKHNSDRADKFKLKIVEEQVPGDYILLAGMSEKAAWVYGLKPLEFELRLMKEIKFFTDRRIIYRPKPSWKDARPIAGMDYSPPEQPLEKVLANTHAIVTHHSNVAIDGLLAGKPCCVIERCITTPMSGYIDQLNNPYFPDYETRKQWVNDVAYTQWKVDEIERGMPWQHAKNEGLI